MGIGIALLFAFERIMIKRLDHTVPSLTVNTYKYVLVAILFLPGLFGHVNEFRGRTLVIVLVSAVLSGVIAAVLMLSGVRRVGATEGAVLSFLEPAVAITLAWLVLGEAPPLHAVVGGLIIVLSGYLVTKEVWAKTPASVRSTD
jgi:drug/metabolite transporter (DMT)-like permease